MTLLRLYQTHRRMGRAPLLALRLARESRARDRALEASRRDALRRAQLPFTTSRAGSL